MNKSLQKIRQHFMTMENGESNNLVQEKQGVKCGTQSKKTQIVSHTTADVNWATIANKITVPNVFKAGMTVAGGTTGALIGAGIGTGIGFAILGPSGAVVGYTVGNLSGLFGGGIVGIKLGKITAKKIISESDEEVIQKGTTEIEIITAKEKMIEEVER